MKKIYLILAIGLLIFGLYGCSRQDSFLFLRHEELLKMNIGDEYELEQFDDESVWISDHEDIVEVELFIARAKSIGIATLSITTSQKTYDLTIVVTEQLSDMQIIGKTNLLKDEEVTFEASIFPSSLTQEVEWESSDVDVVTIDENGLVKAIGVGIATITALSLYDHQTFRRVTVLVRDTYDIIDLEVEVQTNITTVSQTHDLSTFNGLLEPLIQATTPVVIGVSSYADLTGSLQLLSVGSGIIYKRVEINQDEGYPYYQYFVVTNRHVVKDGDVLKIYLDENNDEYPATLIQYDDKVDLAVITFSSYRYFPIARFGDSDAIQTGEFILAIGHSEGYDYLHTATFGIISFPTRYLSDDTDGDGTNDWDAKYIQHDAPINAGNSGGPIINLKGEIIGINTLKISSVLVENLGFAIPSNLAIEIIELLEQGIKPQRAMLGVTVISVKAIIENPNSFPDYTVPDGLLYGFYIVEVGPTGIAHQAGVLAGDIIVSFNHVEIRYSYELRAEIGKFLIGSGEIVEMEVIRNGERITLQVTY